MHQAFNQSLGSPAFEDGPARSQISIINTATTGTVKMALMIADPLQTVTDLLNNALTSTKPLPVASFR